MENKIDGLVDSYRSGKAQYNFFDCNCWLSFCRQRDQFFQVTGVQALYDGLQKHCISQAVASCTECIEYDPLKGNSRLMYTIGPMKNMYGSIVLTPDITFCGIDIGTYLAKAIENKIVAVRLFPKKLRHSLMNWQMRDIFSCMQQHRLPLMLWHAETDWDTIKSICEEYSELPVIIEGNDQKLLYHNRYYIQLLRMYKNLFLETHSVINYLGIESLVNELHIEQLIYGSYFPINDPNSAMMMITHADISRSAKLKIAGGNMHMLIDNIKY
jgi:hypothetical protein